MTKRFQFRLEPILKLRELREKEQQRRLADCRRDVQDAEQKLADLQARLRDTLDGVRRAGSQPTVDVSAMIAEQDWRDRVRNMIEAQHAEIHRLEERLRAERNELAARTRQRKVIEKLRERRHEEHKRTLQRAERAEADESAVQRFACLHNNAESAAADLNPLRSTSP